MVVAQATQHKYLYVAVTGRVIQKQTCRALRCQNLKKAQTKATENRTTQVAKRRTIGS